MKQLQARPDFFRRHWKWLLAGAGMLASSIAYSWVSPHAPGTPLRPTFISPVLSAYALCLDIYFAHHLCETFRERAIWYLFGVGLLVPFSAWFLPMSGVVGMKRVADASGLMAASLLFLEARAGRNAACAPGAAPVS